MTIKKPKSKKLRNLSKGDVVQLQDGRIATIRFVRPSSLFESPDGRVYEISWLVGHTVAESTELGNAEVLLAPGVEQ